MELGNYRGAANERDILKMCITKLGASFGFAK